jgi:hypothetical protein
MSPSKDELRRQVASFSFDRDELTQRALQLGPGYQQAKPFPHVVMDDLVPTEVLDSVHSEFPGPGDVSWWTFDSETERKLASRDDSIMGPSTRHLLAELNSSVFLTFLEALTGITGLIPDPHFFGGGLHQSQRGGFLEIHADFDRHPSLDLERRLNLIVYLNREWDDAYGGHLELWERDMSACAVRVSPTFGRTVVFDTTDHSFHGHPEPLPCPPEVTRKSLALYYYTVPERELPATPHNTLFQTRPGAVSPTRERAVATGHGWRSVVKQALPPIVVNGLGRIRDRRSPAAAATPSTQATAPDPHNVNSMFGWLRPHDVSRPQYLWPVLQAARSAANLGIERLSVVEFGVAGGNGLLALEAAAEAAEAMMPVRIDVFGFDTGAGMPEPVDHRDIPWAIEAGYFAMDEPALRARLRRAQLELGPVRDTVAEWLEAEHAPIGFASFDLDYYSSTVDALGALLGPTNTLLPRVTCYFDDILGFGWSDFNGARAAIIEFNETNDRRKLGQVHGLRYVLPASELDLAWPEKIFVLHAFDHELYNTSEGRPAHHWFEQLRLGPEQ